MSGAFYDGTTQLFMYFIVSACYIDIDREIDMYFINPQGEICRNSSSTNKLNTQK